MAYAFDRDGWYCGEQEFGSRVTSVRPPDCGPSPIVGQDWPSWMAYSWRVTPYITPVMESPSKDAINSPILAKIKQLEDTKMARAMREAALGDTAGLVSLNDSIKALRATLKK